MRALVAISLAPLLAACGEASIINQRLAATASTASAPGWSSAEPADMFAYGDTTGTAVSANDACPYPYAPATNPKTSFVDTSMQSDGTSAVLGFGACIGASPSVRMVGRTFKASGKEILATGFSFIDSPAAGTSHQYLTSTRDPGGSFSFLYFGNSNAPLAPFGGQATWNAITGWGSFLSGLNTPFVDPIPTAKNYFAPATDGTNKSFAIDQNGTSWLAYVPSGSPTEVALIKKPLGGSWSAHNVLQDIAFNLGNGQAQLISDGVGMTSLATVLSGGAYTIGEATWGDSINPNFSQALLYELSVSGEESTAPTPFSADTDGNGTVIAVYEHTDYSVTGTCVTGANGCEHRLFYSIRGATGLWLGPGRLDEGKVARNLSTTYYQSPTEGGVDYVAPAFAYMGNGKFMAVYSVVDVTGGTKVTQVVARGYTVGAGWDALASEKVLLELPHGSATPQIRRVNRMKLFSNRKGEGVLVLQVVPTDGMDSVSTRSFQWAAMRWSSSSGWGTYTELAGPAANPGLAYCPASLSGLNTQCKDLIPEAAVFDSGSVLVVAPGMAPFAAADIGPPVRIRTRLYSWRYIAP